MSNKTAGRKKTSEKETSHRKASHSEASQQETGHRGTSRGKGDGASTAVPEQVHRASAADQAVAETPAKADKRAEKADKHAEKAGKHAETAGKKAEKKSGKQADKHAKQQAKGTAKSAKEARKQARDEAKVREKGESGRLTPGNAKKLVGVAKIVGPVLAPYAARAAAHARATYDQARARQLGVPVDELGSFTGRGAALHARISGDLQGLRDLRSRTDERSAEDEAAIERFASTAETRLGELTSAIRAAERMPAARRRSVHQAAASELDRVENDLLRRFGL